MIEARSEKYAGLLVRFADGDAVHFVDGVASVTVEQAEKLNRLPESSGVVVDQIPDETETPSNNPEHDGSEAPHEKGSSDSSEQQEQPPADNEHVSDGAELFEPKGNAGVDEWRAYAVQQGKDADEVAELKREEIKALLED